MKKFEVLSLGQIEWDATAPIPLNRFEVVGVKLEKEPVIPDLELKLHEREFIPVLVLNPHGPQEARKLIQFEEALPDWLFRNIALPLQDVRGVLEGGFEQAFNGVLLALVKRDLTIQIERETPLDAQVRISLFVGSGFETVATCAVEDLAGFISPEPESDQEFDARMAKVREGFAY